MDLRYLAFCHPGSHFYDVPTSDGDDDGPRFAVDAPADWREHSNAEWTHPSPPGLQLPWQGWKVHVSATPDNADRVLEVAADFCISHALSFKFLRTPAILLRCQA